MATAMAGKHAESQREAAPWPHTPQTPDLEIAIRIAARRVSVSVSG
jgi:hypothetical protein